MKKLFYNATIYLMDKEMQSAQAMLVENGKLLEVYQSTPPPLPDAQKTDLHQAWVCPGFVDTHTHSFEGGLYSQSLDLSAAASLSEALDMIAAYYQKSRHDDAAQLDAFRFDENKIPEQRFPTRIELDQVCPGLPLVLRRIDGHSSVVNSAAWKLFAQAHPTFSDSPMAGAAILRGDLNDQVVHWFHQVCPESTVLQAYHQAAKIAAANGITTVHTMVGDAQNSIMHYKWLRDNLALFPVGFILYPQSFNLEAVLDAGSERIGGCILADGSLGSLTAALSEPYLGQHDNYGYLNHPDAFWQDFITSATEHKLQVAVHCIGDKAIRQINDVYLKLYRKAEHDLRHELIHCELTPDSLLQEIVASHAIPVMQPAFDQYWGGESGFYQKVLGRERRLMMNRFKSFAERNVPLTGGSDWYITELDALQGIRAAVRHQNPRERISPFEAVKMYTSNAAFLSHDEQHSGQLQPGFAADFVCLSGDIMADDKLDQVKILSTYKQGNLIYNNES